MIGVRAEDGIALGAVEGGLDDRGTRERVVGPVDRPQGRSHRLAPIHKVPFTSKKAGLTTFTCTQTFEDPDEGTGVFTLTVAVVPPK